LDTKLNAIKTNTKTQADPVKGGCAKEKDKKEAVKQ
jgi:hypothetical protein